MTAPALRCRPIAEADFASVVALLHEGFPERPRGYWQHALEVMRRRPSPEGFPRFGMMLEADGSAQGVLLQIFSELREGERVSVRCNLSSWYVRPGFRSYAALLVSRALRHKQVTYLNVSPAPHTWPILEAQGYRRYSEGQVACVPALSLRGLGTRVRRFRGGETGLAPEVEALLAEHAEFGLKVLLCGEGEAICAFAFLPRAVKGVGHRVAQLAYCSEPDSFPRYAGPLGRWLLCEGLPLALFDAKEPVPGVVGRFFRGRAPKYYRGARTPRLNDLAYTEAVLFGA